MTQPAPLRLYWSSLSGHSHRAQLGAAVLGVPIELVVVDLKSGAHKQGAFLAKNRFGQIPVLEQENFTLADSNAILIYLAERSDPAHHYWPKDAERSDPTHHYWPKDAERRAQVQRWLSVAAGPLKEGPCNARLARLFGAPLDHALAVRKSHDLLRVLEAELSTRSFLVGAGATLADIALYTYTAHAPEGDVSLAEYSAVRAWLGRIEALPGFVPMQRSPVTVQP